MANSIVRYAAWAAGIILALLALLAFSFVIRLYASLPQTSGRLELAGLRAEAQIVRDEHAVPHIFAENSHDAYYALGVAHAQDRLWQMEITRRALRGRLSEFLGEAGLDSDIWFRTMGLGEAADTAVANLPPDVQGALQAYSDGVNAVISAPGFVAPPEYQFLMFEPEAWTPGDTVTVYKAIALDLFGNAFSEPRLNALIEQLGEERARQFMGRYPDETPRSLSMADLGLEDTADAQSDESIPALGPNEEARDGSNNWVVSGRLTETGHPILANDPHLGLRAPAIWYLTRLTTPEGSTVGVTLPGTPFVTLGRNDHMAWGFTNTAPDVGDLHAVNEDAVIDSREETIAVRFGDTVTITRRATATGPVLDPEHFDYPVPEGADFLALQWMLDEPDDATPGVGMRILSGENWDDFVDAVRGFVAPQQSMVFAAVDGDIGLYAPARIPVRDDTGAWVDTIPFEELPHTRNPERGFIATANNKIIPDGYPHYLTSDWYGVSRITRIYEGLEASERHTMQSMAELQYDTVSTVARNLLPVLLTATPQSPEGQRAIALLAEWNADMAIDIPQPLIFSAWMQHLGPAIYNDELGDQANRWVGYRQQFMEDVLLGDAAHWCADVETGEGVCGDLLGPTLDAAMAELVQEMGGDIAAWQWGDVHYARHAHAPFSDIPLLAGLFTIETPIPGDGSTVNVAHHSWRRGDYSVFHAASYRALYDLGDLDSSLYMITTGQSGHFLSEHYDDLAPQWGRGDYIQIRTDWTPASAPEGSETLRLYPATP